MIKNLLKYFALFCFIYFLLVSFFNLAPIRQGSAKLFRQNAVFVLTTFYPKAFIVSRQHPSEKSEYELQLLYENNANVEEATERAKMNGQSNLDIELQAYRIHLPAFFLYALLFLMALIAANPISIKEKLWKLLLGLIIFLLYTNVRLTLIMYHQFQVKELGIYEVSDFTANLLSKAQFFLTNITANFMVASLIWIVVSFNQDKWQSFVEKLVDQAPAKANERSRS